MWRVSRYLVGGILLVASGGALTALREHPRDFEPHAWRPYVDRRGEGSWQDGSPVEAEQLRPFGAWSPESSLGLLLLHVGVTATLTLWALRRWRALRALQRRDGDVPEAPYRREAEQAPKDPRLTAAMGRARIEALSCAAAMLLPCVTSMREVIVLRLAGTVLRATPTAIGWYQAVRRNGDGGPEHHGVRARAWVAGRAVTLEAFCSFALARRLDAGTVGPEGVPFVVWGAFPRVHQIGTVPVVGQVAGWVHLAFLAALALEGIRRREARYALEAPSVEALEVRLGGSG
jgi:hypothetical protein